MYHADTCFFGLEQMFVTSQEWIFCELQNAVPLAKYRISPTVSMRK